MVDAAGQNDATAQPDTEGADPMSGLINPAAVQPAVPATPPAAPADSAPQTEAAAVQKPAAPKAAAAKDVPPVPPPLPGGPLATVITRNSFYRDGFRNMIVIAILQAVVIVFMILALMVYINNSQSHDRYFATTADGRIMQLVPLDQPNMSPAELMSWVATAATEVMTFGYHDYQRRLQFSSRHFTRRGWESFTNALQRVRIIDSVQQLQQVVTAAPRSAPILVQQGVLNGKYRWLIKMPLQVSYKSGTQSRTDNIMLNLVVERVSSLENPNGVGIEQWVAVQE